MKLDEACSRMTASVECTDQDKRLILSLGSISDASDSFFKIEIIFDIHLM